MGPERDSTAGDAVRDRRRPQRGRPDRRTRSRRCAGAFPARRSGSPTTPPTTAPPSWRWRPAPRWSAAGKPHGKGGNVTAAAEAALERRAGRRALVLLCDGDLGASAARLAPLVEAVERASATSRSPPSRAASAAASGSRSASPAGRSGASAAPSRRRRSPASARCAPRRCARRLPFAAGFGMEIGMTVDAVRAGYRLGEFELDLEHRATGRTLRGFLHRGAQLRDFARVYASRRSLGRMELVEFSGCRFGASEAPAVILAIDQGTTGTTCLVFDDEGAGRRPRLRRVRAALPAARAGSSTTPPRSGR